MSVATAYYGGHAPDVVIPIRTAGLGARFGRYRTEMSLRRVMAYAAGIGADDDLYLDDTLPGGLVAPLGITCATDWQLFITPDWLQAVGRNRDNLFNHLVHGSQVTEFHRPVRPGDLLQIEGHIVEMRNTGAGAVVTARIDTQDAKTGDPVATGWFASLYRETPLDGQDGRVEPVPALHDAPAPEALAGTIALPVPRTQAHHYTECADIWNPIHTERGFARASGLPDIILHGTCTWAMTLQRLAALHRPGSTRPFRRFGARFSGYLVPGQEARILHGRPKEGRIPFAVQAADGRLALSHGFAELAP
ncbi:MAG: MaoC family dehydratase N-terminal domain-containing protein [Rhodobacteraceae bacterium]|nr:MaoC family dehydratase N-terminal domain-containing protein [Paracoccaceae bacterium]